METQEKQPGILDLLKNRDFTRLFVAGSISDIGNFFTFIAIVFLAIAKTSHLGENEAAQAVALISVMNILPVLIFGPFAGALVDRFDRKKFMIGADLIGAASSIGFLFAESIFQMYVLAFLASLTRLFFYPARGAAIPVVVDDPRQLLKANGFIQTIAQLSYLIGPALAGIIIASFGLKIAFIVDAVSFSISAIIIFMINKDLKPKTDGSKVSMKKIVSDMKAGFVIVSNDRIMKYLLGMMFIAMLGIGMINPLFALYLNNTFGLGEKDFGFIMSLSAVSGLIGAIVLSSRKNMKRKLTVITSSLFVVTISVTLLGAAPLLPNPVLWLYVAMAMVGLLEVLLNVPFAALFQTIIANENLGKVGGILNTVLSFAQVIGAVTASFLVLGLSISTLFISVGLFVGFVWLSSMIVMTVKKLEQEAQNREAAAIAAREAQETQTDNNEIIEPEVAAD